ncbi:glycerate dehydrogenase [Nibricoccus aquaticus]|uniref:Glycerate dehydrogenase n=1 Tax=Nibricoccus aquaticus TaxID=2576891 RepID=A0A290Q7F8_9BACT|nr:hydroxyacid dehydrogenase [Nibricoccus aquaticus]ATC64207.1 glycerate dehydrogenase [Nibricoccus aquaticus]
MNIAFLMGADVFRDTYGDECFNAASALGRVLGAPLTAEELADSPPPWLGEVEVLFTGWLCPRLDTALLTRMPRLRVVFHGAGSLRGILTEESWARGIVFANAAALNAIPTAEYAFGSILLSLKRAWQQAAVVRQRRAYSVVPSVSPLPLPGGVDSTVGLASLGQVGRRVAEWLGQLDVKIIAHDPFASAETFARLKIRPVSLDQLFAEADIVSLHTPLLPATAGMVNARLLARMKPGATLINTARGGLVNERDLVAALRDRPDLQAILDVTDPEPPEAMSPLYDLPNVFLTPHLAGSLGPECRRMGRAMVDEFGRFLRGEPLRHGVTREEFMRMA